MANQPLIAPRGRVTRGAQFRVGKGRRRNLAVVLPSGNGDPLRRALDLARPCSSSRATALVQADTQVTVGARHCWRPTQTPACGTTALDAYLGEWRRSARLGRGASLGLGGVSESTIRFIRAQLIRLASAPYTTSMAVGWSHPGPNTKSRAATNEQAGAHSSCFHRLSATVSKIPSDLTGAAVTLTVKDLNGNSEQVFPDGCAIVQAFKDQRPVVGHHHVSADGGRSHQELVSFMLDEVLRCRDCCSGFTDEVHALVRE
jgi:hypothetical protein